MSLPEVIQFFNDTITAHAWNGDRSQVAICPNTNEVHIYAKTGDSWACTQILSEHDKTVTSIDWAPKTNRIVTCSQDRNAYVWTWDRNTWKPTLVLLRINRAATHVRWSPNEKKFAVASGARCISICYFEAENDWWVSKHIRKPIRSTVLCLDWHPNNILIAAGSADMKARVFSAYIKDVDDKCPPCAWGDKFPINTVCGEFSTGSGGWVHSVAFSPDGESLGWVSHDSTLSVASPALGGKVSTVRTPYLPYRSLIWATPNSIIAAGHDYVPVLFTSNNSGDWQYVEKLDQPAKKAVGGSSAMNKFKQLDSRAQETATAETEINTTHQNAISAINFYAGTRQNVTKFSTSGVDGRIVIWDVKSIESSIAGLKIR